MYLCISIAGKLQSRILAPVSFCLQGIAWFTLTMHLGNMICASLLTQSKQWMADFKIPSNNVSCFCCFYTFVGIHFNIGHTLYPASQHMFF